MRKLLGCLALLVAAVGCGSTKLEAPPPSPNKALGLLEVTLDFTDELNPTTSTNFKPFTRGKNGLSLQSISGNGNETSQIALKRRNASFIDDNESAVFGTQNRYVRATFDIANFSSRSFKNLNFMAISLNSQLGTMFTSLKDGSDATVALTDTVPTGELTYRALKPTHGMRLAGANLEVDPEAADMQVFTNPEADSVQTDLSATYPGVQVLEYGYSARSIPASTTSRSIGITPTTADCSSTLTSPPNGYTFVTNNVNCFTGRVTFAFKLPRKPIRGQNPFAFSFVFVVADESAPNTTQSLEEQSLSKQISREQVVALDLPFGEQRLHRTLPGSLAGLLNPAITGVQSKMFCKVKTAVSTPNLAADYLSRQIGISSVLPSSNNPAASRSGSVQATFCDTMSAATKANFAIQSFQTGQRSSSNGVYSGVGSTLSYTPSTNFKAGEEIEVTLTNQITRVADGAALKPFSYRFRTATTPQVANGFTQSNLIAAGNSTTDLTTGDFNNDGTLDLVVLSSGDATIYLGSGTGDFTAQSTIVTNPREVKTADFNGDGKLDLALLVAGSNNVGVYLGSGTGSFGSPTNYPAGANPIGLETADFNSDGKLDLVVSNYNADTVSVLLGSGTGAFNPKPIIQQAMVHAKLPLAI
jgi:hypothetical protein